MIFAREISDGLTSLVKKIDEATVSNSKSKMGSFVVVCKDDEGMADKLKALAKKESLKKTVLSLEGESPGGGYKLAKEADVTVVLYTKRKSVAEFAYKKGELKSEQIEEILAALPKILPAKK